MLKKVQFIKFMDQTSFLNTNAPSIRPEIQSYPCHLVYSSGPWAAGVSQISWLIATLEWGEEQTLHGLSYLILRVIDV